ncbi:serine/threonine-protein kinase AtPK2/AtPK19-like [Impatiens glandulifera]|uniref:serine/threonine-protein kinase AtPK2/AtPK19-like n=1 Tax=Impatiens glandulifera TaxID=253017 RepID=UPI001FB14661|nr:serine/threonine-protein kinase AtPK2/AtPK19-like [Impatiens glandulifera]
MVSSQLPTLAENRLCKSFLSKLFTPKSIPKYNIRDDLHPDFSDVFGPFVPSSHEVVQVPANDQPKVIYHRSQSLVGPSSNCVNQSLILSKHDDVKEVEELLASDSVIKVPTKCDCIDDNVPTIGLEDFEVMKVVGQGGFGKVYQVRKKGTCEIYAMKVMRKDKIMEKNHAGYMKAERDILTKIQHPFIVQLRYSFQTKYRLYLVLDFMNGGHLFFQLYHQGLFREDLARIYAAEIVSAVCHLHANSIMHRDLKPENILLDADGHIILTDFGLAKQFDDSNSRSNSLCGTVEYMSPEIVLGKGHDKGADWWSVGILLFEMLTGKTPFCGGNREKIQQKIVKERIKLPGFLTSEAHAILKALLQKDPTKRMGNGVKGSEEVKSHKWFKGIDWKKLEDRKIQPSFKPEIGGTDCVANFDKKWTDMALQDSPASSPKTTSSINPFRGFNYQRPSTTTAFN